MKSVKQKTNWQIKKLGEVLEYEQPSLYIVSSKNYKDDYETPVLTAGKSFILGKTKEKNGIFPKDKLPVIIFDDFTTATKFVNFPFKVKSSAMKILHPVKNISDAKFLFYLIQNISFDHTGIHKRYWMSEYSKIEILLPPLPEQHRIVKIFDEVFADVAKAKENAEKNLQNTKELFESYLQSIFANSGKDWEERMLGDIAKVEYGYTDKSKDDGEYRYIRITDINENGLLNEDKRVYVKKSTKTNNFILKDGDILTARVGASCGEVLFFEEKEKSVFASYLIRIKFEKDILNKLYWYFSKSKLYWNQEKMLSAGSAQPQFNGNVLKKIIFPYPKAFGEQKSIVTKLDELSAETKKLETIYRQKLADLEELKKSVLKRAFNGDL